VQNLYEKKYSKTIKTKKSTLRGFWFLKTKTKSLKPIFFTPVNYEFMIMIMIITGIENRNR